MNCAIHRVLNIAKKHLKISKNVTGKLDTVYLDALWVTLVVIARHLAADYV
jgi:hypothetical protein